MTSASMRGKIGREAWPLSLRSMAVVSELIGRAKRVATTEQFLPSSVRAGKERGMLWQ